MSGITLTPLISIFPPSFPICLNNDNSKLEKSGRVNLILIFNDSKDDDLSLASNSLDVDLFSRNSILYYFRIILR